MNSRMAVRCFVAMLAFASALFAGLENTPSGRLWMTDGTVNATSENTTDNTLYLGGAFTRVMPVTGNLALLDHADVADLMTDGTEVNNTFAKLREGCTAIYAVESDGAGGWYVGGDFDVTIGGVNYTNLMHIDASGLPDDSWKPNPDNIVRAIKLDTTNDIVYFGGDFDSLEISPAGGWYDSNWSYRKEVFVDGANITGNNSGITLLIKIDADDDLRSAANGGNVAQDDGGDILITNAAGTQLYHEIEKYDPVTGELILWVSTQVTASTDHIMYLYYGNDAGGLDESDANNTWNNANFIMVQHFEETASVANEVTDDSGEGCHGTPVGYSASAGGASGKIGDAIQFNGTSQHVRIDGNTANFDNIIDELTIACWVRMLGDSSDSDHAPRLVAKGLPSGGTDAFGLIMTDVSGSGELTLQLVDGGGANATVELTYAPGASAEWLDLDWHYIVATFDAADSLRLYVDGAEVASTPSTISTINVGGAAAVTVGNGTDGVSEHHRFNGRIDEMNIQEFERSAAWVSTTYANQNDPDSFHTIGAEEAFVPTFSKIAAVQTDGTQVATFVAEPDDIVRAIAVNSTGTEIFIGGDFANVTDSGGADGQISLAKLDATGTVDTAFPEASAASAIVYALAVETDDSKLYVGGACTVGGEVNFIPITIATDTVITTWDAVDSTVRAIALDGAGTLVYLGGEFANIGAGPRDRVGAITVATGVVAGGFADPNISGGTAIVYSLACTGTELYVGGDFTAAGSMGGAHTDLACLNTDGTEIATDLNTYVASGNATVYAIGFDGTAEVLAGGTFMSVSGLDRANLAALNFDEASANYGRATTWDPGTMGGTGEVVAIAVGTLAANDVVCIAGDFTNFGANAMAGQGFGIINTIDDDGVAGGNVMGNGAEILLLVRETASEIIVGGSFTDVTIDVPDNLFRMDLNNLAVPDAIAVPDDTVRYGVLDGTVLYIGGDFADVGGTGRNSAAAIDLTTDTLDPAWDPDITLSDGVTAGVVHSIAVGTDKIYIGGDFARVGGDSSSKLAAVEKVGGGNTGDLDATFDPVGSPGGNVLALGIYGDLLFVGGAFNNFGPASDVSFVTLDADTGALDTTFSPIAHEASQPVNHIAIYGDTIVVGGAFEGESDLDRPNFLGEFPAPVLAVTETAEGAITNGEAAGATARNFGSTPTYVAVGPITITVENSTGGSVNLGTPSLSAGNTADFELDLTGFDSTLYGGESTTFDITFLPLTDGSKSATVSFTHDAETTASPFTFEVAGDADAPDMSVTEGGDDITNGQAASGAFAFGAQDISFGPTAAVTVTIENAVGANGDLVLGTPSLSGSGAAHFVLTAPGVFPMTVIPNDTYDFTIAFDPSATGDFSATISFTHNDPAMLPTPFTINISGSGDEPTISVQEDPDGLASTGDEIPIAYGAVPAGGRDFGTILVGNQSDPVAIRVINASGLAVVLGTPTFTGAGANAFAIDSTTWDGTLDPGASTAFSIIFEPSIEGTFGTTATPINVRFSHNDPNQTSPFTFEITGSSIEPSPLNITPTSMPDGEEGEAYSQTMNGTGGSSPYTWVFESGSLPDGITFNTATAIVSGTPVSGSSGTYTFSLKITDANGEEFSRTLRIDITAPNLPLPKRSAPCALDANGARYPNPLFICLAAMLSAGVYTRRRRFL
ncbi:MAG: DUF2341 domain-containing protein [Planctomycetaceae bacterium]|nr:DUF2341 domain-containing protein [Planctomycetaceae bacterium]